jgi:3-deoxy-manno-octulosonate cytidylyltransferase (CMP-KDO synthetase)
MLMEVGVLGDKVKAVCIIPARYGSSRFEGKPLANIDGVPMIKRTYMQAMKSETIGTIVVATDDKRIFSFCESENINVIFTSNKCLTGTDRVAEVAKHKNYSDYDFYINIQGDEPIIDPIVIDQLVNAYIKYGDNYIAYNLYKKIENISDISSSSIIKVIVNVDNELMYMSRLPVPYSKSNLLPVYKMQIPAYGYTSAALDMFSKYSKTLNEQFEDIELLRFIDLGYKLKMIETNAVSISVDFPEDILKIEKYLNS